MKKQLDAPFPIPDPDPVILSPPLTLPSPNPDHTGFRRYCCYCCAHIFFFFFKKTGSCRKIHSKPARKKKGGGDSITLLGGTRLPFWGGRCLQVQYSSFFLSVHFRVKISIPPTRGLAYWIQTQHFLPGDRERERECVRGVSFLVFMYVW
jgi:hypothetical protein